MWIASVHGWFSIVKKDGGFHVRSRSEEDLKTLQHAVGGEFAKLTLHQTPEADYCARVFVPEEQGGLLGEVMRALGDSVTYENFKDAVGEREKQRDKVPFYHQIWHVMYGYQTQILQQLQKRGDKRY